MPRRRRQSVHAPRALPIEATLRLLTRMLRQRIWLIAGCIAAAVLAGLIYLARAPRVYQAYTVVQVQTSEKNPLTEREGSTGSNDLDKLESLKTIEYNLGRRDLLRRLIKNLPLTPADLDLSPARTWLPDEMTDTLANLVSVNLVRGTRLITVQVLNTDPARAARIADAVVAEYGRALFEQRSGSSTQANEFLVQEAERLKKKLQASEQALQNYREQTNAVSLEESQNIIVAQLKELNAKLTDAKGERLKLESASALLQQQGAVPVEQLLAIPQIANSPQVVEQQRQYAAMQAEVAKLEERYLELHPKLIQAKGQLAQTRENLRAAASDAAKSLVALVQNARETEAKYQTVLTEQEQKALALNRLSIPYNVLNREVVSDQAMFDSIMKRLKETDVSKGIDPEIIQVVEHAAVPRVPVKPRKKLILAGSLAAGVLLGLAATLVLWTLDSSFRTVDEIEEQLGVPVLAAVPHRSGRLGPSHGRAGRRMAEAAGEPLIAESFRTLRTTLALQGSGSRTALFTSSAPGEGKSFCAVNYALALAAGGARTLLIDADLRLPVIGQVFATEATSGQHRRRGLAEVLDGSCSLSLAATPTDFEGLSIVPAGRLRADPGVLFLGDAFAELLRSAESAFDHVVIDSAPVHAVADTLAIARLPVSVLLVVMSGSAPRQSVLRAAQMLKDAGGQLAGVVLNGVPERGEYYYHYRTDLSDSPAETAPAVLPQGTPPERPSTA
jgi:capsular exopolysaccharide synthesis family protein